jgi:hypothetical protein
MDWKHLVTLASSENPLKKPWERKTLGVSEDALMIIYGYFEFSCHHVQSAN